jgi:hypothetical protein
VAVVKDKLVMTSLPVAGQDGFHSTAKFLRLSRRKRR